MKSFYWGLLCLLLVLTCKPKTSETPITEDLKELSIAQKIANAHGFENFKNVETLKFTFNVDRDSIKGKGRNWVWKPKEDVVISERFNDTLQYTRSKIDSTNINTDRAFINDKFWLLVPFQLVWDTSATLSEAKKMTSPIYKTPLHMITITYSSEGGYTPGDAYDIFYDDKYLIKEWVFRKGNSKKPSLTTTFENYKDFNGIKIATEHKQEGGHWNLNFTNITVTLK